MMVVVFDSDDVLLNFGIPLTEFVKKKGIVHSNFKKEDVFSFNLWESWKCSPEESKNAIYDFYESEDFDNLKANEGMFELLKKINKKHDIYVVTRRHDDLNEITKKQFETNFPGLIKGIILTGHYHDDSAKTKAEICAELKAEFFIDDHIGNFIGVQENVKKILFDQPWNQISEEEENRLGLIRAKSADDIARIMGLY